MGMTDKEKVIKGLECCATNRLHREDCEAMDCVYLDLEGHGCIHQLIRDALALLKAQEPRVMTADDMPALRKGNVIVLEQHEKGIVINAIFIQRITHDDGDTTYTEALEVVTAYTEGSAWLGCDEYGKVWRCWTSRPTDEQREAIPWMT